jgi:hypothetical protein
MENTVYSPLSDHPYNRRFPPSDCLSGRQTEAFVRELHPLKEEILHVNMIAGNRAQSLKEL